MARTPNPVAVVPADLPALPFDEDEVRAEMGAASARYLEVSALYGDARPYDRTRLVELAKVHARNSSESMLELGKCLLLIREGEGQGAWEDVCERQVGIAPQVARRLIQATTKYCSPKLSPHRSTLSDLGRSKLYELLVLDDEPLAALADGGTVAGLNLDEVERMSVRELRTALRAARDDRAATEKVMADKAKVIDRQATELAKLNAARAQGSLLVQVAVADEEQHAMQLRAELSRRVYACEKLMLGDLPLAIEALLEHARTSGEPVHDLISGHLHQLAGDIESLMLRYNTDTPRGRARPDSDIWDAVNAELAAKADGEDSTIN